MNKTLLIFLLLACHAISSIAQDRIETDRPTETLSAKLVGKGSFQVETGVRKDQQNNADYSLKHPDVEWRYGLLNRLELWLSTITETQRFPTEGKMAYGLLPLELGLKAGLYQNRDTSFLITAYGHVGVRQWASKDHQPNKSFYRARLLLQNEFTNKFGVQYNLGRDWMGDDGEQA